MPSLHLSILLQAASIAIIASVTAYVYVTILTQPDQVLGWWKTFVHNTYVKITGWETEKYFKYKSFKDFNYLTFEPTAGQLLFVYFITIVVSVGCLIWCVKNNLNNPGE